MTRARAFVGAVPQRVWTAVAGLALLASLAVAAVIGAGLSVWRSAVGSSAQPPTSTLEPPSSGLVVLPGAPARAHPGKSGHPGLSVGRVRAVGHHVVPARHVSEVRSGGRGTPSPAAARPAVARAVPVPVPIVVPVRVPVPFTPWPAVTAGFDLGGASPSVAQVTKFVAHAQHEAAAPARHAAEKHARHAAATYVAKHKAHEHKAGKHKAGKHKAHERGADKHRSDRHEGDRHEGDRRGSDSHQADWSRGDWSQGDSHD